MSAVTTGRGPVLAGPLGDPQVAPAAGALLPQHAAELAASAIAPSVITARGYRSVTGAEELAQLGFADYQCRAPGLLIPIRNTAGRLVTYQYKPDAPRNSRSGKPVKYESPAGARLALDVPPGVRTVLSDASIRLGITEGSKKADAAVSHGLPTISISGVYGWRGQNGAGGKATLPDFDDIALDGREVWLLFDSDLRTNSNVRQALDRLAEALGRRGAQVRVIFLPPVPDDTKVGLDDFFAAGGTVEALTALAVDDHVSAPLSGESAEAVATPADWPAPLDPAALHGIAGKVVESLLRYTEADAAGLLLTFLAAIGNIVGTGPHWEVSGRRHPLLFWPVLVGTTAKGRKGTTWGIVRALLGRAFPEWASTRVNGGLSSGEGLIWLVRDQILKPDGTEVDPGVTDKRLFLVEEEFSGMLRVAGREGNSLSAVLRKGWDGDILATLTKNSPARATGPHITVVGHSTAEELRRHLDDVQIASGLANRFVFACVRRSKLLPDGASIDDELLGPLAKELEEALAKVKGDMEIRRDAEASELWRTLYGPLSEGSTGLLGAITSRAEAQVLRVAAIYAVLDGSAVIHPAHLRAAVAVWDYCESSVRFIFGDRLGDPIADTIKQALAAGELTQTEILTLFDRNAPAAKVNRALSMLVSAGLVEQERRASGAAGGRPATVWRLRKQ